MTDLAHMAPHELVARIDNLNRRFKIASVIFGAVLLVGLVAILVIGLQTLQGVDTQLSSQKKLLNSQQQVLANIKAGSDQNATNVKDLQNHIDCIVELLRQPNRSSLTIKDLNGCQFDSNGNIISGSSGANNNGNAQAPTTAPINSNRSTNAPATNSQPAIIVPPQVQPTVPKPGAVQRVVNNIFCPLNLANLTCRK